MQKITPFLWYAKEAEEAAAFYASIFPDSRVTRVTTLPSESPSGPPGSVKIVEFVLFGQPFMAMSAGPLDPFNHAVSFVVNCDDQAELDRYWNALLEGGSAEQCGWLKDRFGLSWQIVPTVLDEMMAEPDRAKAKRASDAMMKMVKLDIAAPAGGICRNDGGVSAGSLIPIAAAPAVAALRPSRRRYRCRISAGGDLKSSCSMSKYLTGASISACGSTPSRQLTRTAKKRLPLPSSPCANERTPHCAQNLWWRDFRANW